MSLRDTILGADDLKKESVKIPEWNGVTIELREMSGAGRNKYFELVNFDKDGKAKLSDMYAASIVLSARDPETGELIFTPEDIPVLQDKNADVITKIGTSALKLSGLEPKISTEDAEKN